MNRKKLSVIFFVGFAIISGCGKSVSEIKDSNLVENDTLEGDITFSTEETSGDSNEGFVQMSADELLDRFVNGEVSAHCLYDTAKTFYITELDMDSEEWDAYSIGDREDLDNDGEEELILCGPYGGKYLDARRMVKCMNLLQEMGQLKVCLIPIIRDMYGSCTAMR